MYIFAVYECKHDFKYILHIVHKILVYQSYIIKIPVNMCMFVCKHVHAYNSSNRNYIKQTITDDNKNKLFISPLNFSSDLSNNETIAYKQPQR